MKKSDEIKNLRAEITRLKVRLSELDPKVEPTSVVCGHDVALENLRKLSTQHRLTGLAQLAAVDERHGWYTTNVVPEKLRALLESGEPVRDFLSAFLEAGVWEALEAAFHGETLEPTNNGVAALERRGLIENGKLTMNGFICYAVLGHLVFNLAKKLSIRKMIEISKLTYDCTGVNLGENLPYSPAEFIKLLSEHADYPKLMEHDISDSDIAEYLRQNNV